MVSIIFKFSELFSFFSRKLSRIREKFNIFNGISRLLRNSRSSHTVKICYAFGCNFLDLQCISLSITIHSRISLEPPIFDN